MHVLITRPEHDAAPWRERLSAIGIASTVDPMLSIAIDPPAPLDLTGVQLIVVTSRNALRWLSQVPNLPSALRLPLFTVGPGSAEAARTLGFTSIEEGAGTARDLAPLIASKVQAGDGVLLHLSGDKLAFDLASALEPMGYRVGRRIVYRSQPASALRPETIAKLSSGAIDTVALLSPLSAQTFVKLLSEAGLSEHHHRLVYVCLSHNIANRLKGLAARDVAIATAPNAEAVLSCLEHLAGPRRAC
jgi:uroporphyrinogen-III synthase